MKIKLLLIFIVFIGCKESQKQDTFITQSVINEREDTINNKYCFDEIKDSLSKLNIYNQSEHEGIYHTINKEKLLKKKIIKTNNYFEKIHEFYDYSGFVDSYVLKKEKNEYLILIGKALGATGIGVDYWNYQCYSLDVQKNILEFSSLSKTPFSIYLNNQDKLCYIEITDNYPRPANGENITLDNFPVITSVFCDGREVFKLEYYCDDILK